MTEQFKSIINTYLASKINYALLIDGGWGEGKTHYIIEGQFQKDTKKKVVYTTVYGIKDLKEIDDQIVYEKLKLNGKLGKIATSKNANVVFSIAKAVAKGFMKNKLGIGDEELKNIGDVVDESKAFDISNAISISNDEILIIDDLERLHESIPYQELLGYISANYIEGTNIKVILIANENELILRLKKDKKEEEYQVIKEKTIWQTVKFESDLEENYDSILKTFENSSFKEKMVSLKPYIIGVLKKYEILNLRNLQYFFHCLLVIFKDDDKIILDDDKNLMIRSLIILVNEYKTSKVSFNITDPMPSYYNLEDNYADDFSGELIYQKAILNYNKGEGLSKLEAFLIKYIERDKPCYHTYKSIFRLVFNGYLDLELLRKESKSYLEILSPTKQKFIDLENLYKIPEIELKEFTKSFKSVKENLKKGKYDLYRIFDLSILFESSLKSNYPFPIDRNEFHELLEKCLKKNNSADKDYISKYLDRIHTSDYPHAKPIEDKIKAIGNNKYQETRTKARVSDFKRLLDGERSYTLSILEIVFESSQNDFQKLIKWATKSSKNLHFLLSAIRRNKQELTKYFKNDEDNIPKIESLLSQLKLKLIEQIKDDFIFKGIIENNERYFLKMIDQYKKKIR